MARSSSSLPRRPRASGKKEETHDRILSVASRALRRRGLGGVGVADVMKEAGLTHGGFYAHFDSREALLAESLDRMRRDMAQVLERRYADRKPGESRFRTLVETYLADDNLPAFETGCPVAALGSELARCAFPMPKRRSALQSAAAALANHLLLGIERALPEGVPEDAAPVIASTLMGALQMARMLGDGPEARAVLAATRQALLSQYDPLSTSAPI